METKPRILYIQKILLERTDEKNPLSTTQLKLERAIQTNAYKSYLRYERE